MNAPGIQTRSTTATLDVIAPFAETADPRLRGNAIYALTALIDHGDANLKVHAEEQLVRALSSEPGHSGAEWQRRFRPRVVDALSRLPLDVRVRIADRVSQELRRTKESAQQASAAGLLIAASVDGKVVPPIGWTRMLWLTFLAGRPNLWVTAGLVAFRTAFIIVVFAVAIAQLPATLTPNPQALLPRLADNMFLTTFGILVLALLSLAGQPAPSLRTRSVDIIISGGVFAVISILAANLSIQMVDNGEWPMFQRSFALLRGLGTTDALHLGLLGFVVGAGVRIMRWAAASFVIEVDRVRTVTRPLAAIVMVTLICMACSLTKVSPILIGTAWFVLVPAAATAAWVDAWLESEPPQSYMHSHPKTNLVWPLSVMLGTATLLAFLVAYTNAAKLRDARETIEATTRSFPADFATNGMATANTFLSVPVWFDIEREGDYHLVTRGSGDLVLKIYAAPSFSENYVPFKEVDDPDPPAYKGKIPRGKYVACVLKYGDHSNNRCSSFVLSITTLTATVIGNAPVKSAELLRNAADISITLSTVSTNR